VFLEHRHVEVLCACTVERGEEREEGDEDEKKKNKKAKKNVREDLRTRIWKG